MLIKYCDKLYDIEKLAENSEYFLILKSSSFSEKINGVLDLTYRGKIMENVLDLLSGDKSYVFDSFYPDKCIFNLPSSTLIEIKVILDEFLVSKEITWNFNENNPCNSLDKVFYMESQRNKIGDFCYECGKKNSWYKLDANEYFSYDYSRDDLKIYEDLFCTCSYYIKKYDTIYTFGIEGVEKFRSKK